MKKVYLIHKGKKGAVLYNKQQAIKSARKFAAHVRSMDYWLFNQCAAWDIPTFYVQSDKVEF